MGAALIRGKIAMPVAAVAGAAAAACMSSGVKVLLAVRTV
jgi:hypothetical protein